jgi:stage III sporulation protein AB
MVKLVGALMTGFACGYFGIRISMNMKKRAQSLSEIVSSLELLESEISFGLNKLSKAFRRIDKNGFFARIAENMREMGIERAWSESVEKNKQRLCLTESDCDALLILSGRIGKTDKDDQLKNIKYVKSMLNSQFESAKSEYARMGRLYRNGGVLIGLMIAIVLA